MIAHWWNSVYGILYAMFQWPQGIVVGNLIASALWVPIGAIHFHKKLNKQHNERMDLATTQHQEHLDLLNQQHQEHMDAISNIGTST